ncbi:hypothetical protein [Sphingobacterium spiritivorum]|uniref:hypothetical protein n=1 Tax=Sphingobacterium spiritivorum TaxID=258 RepID=UPI0019199BBF|nr:hypothetical protein [Sphingobacterium spiritivorum]QQT25550.1 hypothetical protein I6J02_17795 [Sphingobacterium spiritivorum]
MKYFIILTSLWVVLSSNASAQKLKVTTIYTEPNRVTKEIPETGAVQHYTTRKEIAERLNPTILLISKKEKTVKFRIQGNISSGGHNIHQVSKIRLEKGEEKGNILTLKCFVEIKKIPGKESADIAGYNYTKDETCKIPDDVKAIKMELYEERITDPSGRTPKLIAEQTFNFFAKM